MKPIPKRLLIHRATAIKQNNADMWNNKADKLIAQLENIRVEPSDALEVTKDNRQIKLSAVLFFDCTHSKPTAFDFSETDIIEALGNRYEIISVDKLYDESKLHHYEVGLCL